MSHLTAYPLTDMTHVRQRIRNTVLKTKREEDVFDTDKFVWLQRRDVCKHSKLYNDACMSFLYI